MKGEGRRMYSANNALLKKDPHIIPRNQNYRERDVCKVANVEFFLYLKKSRYIYSV